jgi:hypothetical protein
MELKNLSKKDQGDILVQLGYARPAMPTSLGSVGNVVAAALKRPDSDLTANTVTQAHATNSTSTASSVASTIKGGGLKVGAAMGKLFGTGGGNPFK